MACRDSGGAKCAGTQTTSATGVMALSVFYQASCSWRSEGLFGQSFSKIPPVQALRGLPCLGSFSVVWHIRHIEGPHGWGPAHQALKGALWVGFCSVAQCIRHLMGQPLYCSAADASCGEMDQGDGREEIVVGHACEGKPGSHGSKVILLSHT